MERESSGFDLLYEVLTSQGRSLPKVSEGSDHVEVTIPRPVIKPEVIDFLAKADQTIQLSQRERIEPGVLKKLKFPAQTSLARIESHRLRALNREDLQRHPGAAFGEIHERIGREIPDHQIRGQ